MTIPTPPPAGSDAIAQVRRIAWLHFANDFTLDFLTPLLPAGVGVAWLGVMEGSADAVGQVLKLITGRASDRSGRRASWVGMGYLVNAMARPLSSIGLLLSLPAWIVLCRIADRVGKGIRGSATDALVADWTDGEARAHAFARMRTMDHLGATLGGLAAAGAAWWLAPGHLWIAIAALAVVALLVAWLARGLRDSPKPPSAKAPPAGWWPRSPAVRQPILAIGVACLAAKISPLLVLVQVAGWPGDGSTGGWPLWQVCLGWAALGLVQAGASAVSGSVTARLGPAAMLRLGWLAGGLVFAGLALLHGPWLMVAGLLFGVLAGFTEGAEKTWLADAAPREERAVAFGAMALVTAIAGLAGNAACGWLLMHWGPHVFLVMAGISAAAIALTWRRGT